MKICLSSCVVSVCVSCSKPVSALCSSSRLLHVFMQTACQCTFCQFMIAKTWQIYIQFGTWQRDCRTDLCKMRLRPALDEALSSAGRSFMQRKTIFGLRDDSLFSTTILSFLQAKWSFSLNYSNIVLNYTYFIFICRGKCLILYVKQANGQGNGLYGRFALFWTKATNDRMAPFRRLKHVS